MFKRIKNYFANKGLCYSASSMSNRVRLHVCNDLNAARINTPYSNILVDLDDVTKGLTQAYKDAQDAKDEKVMEEVHSIRNIIAGVYV